MFQLHVCFREHSLHAALDELHKPWFKNKLDVADVHVVDTRTQSPRMLIELKTPADLAASIIDGRLRDERQRMLEYAAELHANGSQQVLCVLVMVGEVAGTTQAVHTLVDMQPVETYPSSYDIYVRKQRLSTLRSALWRLIVRDGIHVMHAPTYKILAEDLHRLVEHNAVLLDQAPMDHERARRLQRGDHKGKRDVDPRTTMVDMLRQIDGMSVIKAQAIRDVFGGKLLALTDAIRTSERMLERAGTAKEKEGCLGFLADISCSGRKLGPVLAARVIEHMGGRAYKKPSPHQPAHK